MRLIDAEKLKYRLEKRIDESNNEEFINGLLEAQVEVDFSETKDIVLCKDCKYSAEWSDKQLNCKWFDRLVFPNGFCSNGREERMRFISPQLGEINSR